MPSKGPRSWLVRKLLYTESPWNPKIVLGRAIVRIVPKSWLFAIKRDFYYPRLAATGGIGRDGVIMRNLIAPGDHVLDVGASIGQYTRFLSESVGPAGKVYSFEALPPTFEILSSCVRKLGLGNVTLINCAISDGPGTATMVIPVYRWGSECHYDARMEEPNDDRKLRRFDVQTRSIDSVFEAQREKISFIKCDVNHHELAFVHGSMKTIQRFKPAMLVEIGTNPDKSIAEHILEILSAEGYAAYRFDGKLLHPRTPGMRNQDWYFLCPSHVSLLRERCPEMLGADCPQK